VAQQQKDGSQKGIIMDGRDIGTVVFPRAEFENFHDSGSSVRVERRFREMLKKIPTLR